MKEKINSIDINGKLDNEQIYNLFKTNSSKENKEISEKIDIYKRNMDFFYYYSNKDIKNLFNIFELKISENNNEIFSSFESDIEQYICCISQIILSLKLTQKIQEILEKIVIVSKNHLLKLKNENKLENYNQDYLFLYLESFFKNSEKRPENYSNTSSTLNNNISLFEVIPKYSKFRKALSENKNDGFSNGEIEPIIYDESSTPKFESDEEFENQEKKKLDSITYHSNLKKGMIFTFSEFVFAEEPSTPQNIESKLIESPMIKPKTKNSTRIRIPQNDDINKINYTRQLFSETDVTIKNNKKNHCRNLLEMINSMYKKGLINSEEKVKLKKLVINKSKKIEYFYYNIYKNSKNLKNTLLYEVKKIVNEFENE